MNMKHGIDLFEEGLLMVIRMIVQIMLHWTLRT